MARHSIHALSMLLAAALLGTGCERLGIPDPAKIAAEKEAEGKAVGAGCRHAGRSLEDCYGLNEEAHKASVFAGWKEMNDYMAANNIAVAPPQIAQAGATTPAGSEAAAKGEKAAASQESAPEPAAGKPAKH
jgi:hypothetical protein